MIQLIKNTLSIHKQNWLILAFYFGNHTPYSQFISVLYFLPGNRVIDSKNTGFIWTQENIRLMLIHPLSIHY